MSTLKDLRLSLGLTQQQLADMLGITRTQLSMAELNRRLLPTSALLRMGNLEIQITAQTSSRIEEELQRQSQKARNFLSAQILENNRLAAVTNIKLEKLRDQHKQFLKALQGVTNLLNNLEANDSTNNERLFLEIVEAGLLKKMDTCGIEQQTALQMKIEAHLTLVRYAESKMI